MSLLSNDELMIGPGVVKLSDHTLAALNAYALLLEMESASRLLDTLFGSLPIPSSDDTGSSMSSINGLTINSKWRSDAVLRMRLFIERTLSGRDNDDTLMQMQIGSDNVAPKLAVT